MIILLVVVHIIYYRKLFILRQVCAKNGVKQMSVSVGVIKSLDFQNLGGRRYRCEINEVK